MTNSLWLIFLTLFSTNVHANSILPVTGNLKGSVTLVEYYDYTCPHCRRMRPVIAKLQKHCPQLRIVYRPTPVLSLLSRPLAAFVLAAYGHKGWLSIHSSLIKSSSPPTIADANFFAQQAGLNPARLWSGAQSSIIQKQLEQNIQLAKMHSRNGTIELPMLVIGRTDGKGRSIVLKGEQSYRLLYEIIQALDHNNETSKTKSVPATK